jgi:hypothetical protein
MDAAVGRLCRHHAAAISSISSKIEVAHVLEGMLDDLEAWQWAGRVKELEARLRRSEATVAALRAAEEKHLQREAEFRAKEEKDAARAEELRGRLAREMWNVAKELKRQRAQRVRTAELSVQVARLQGMEEELSRARIELAAAQVASSPPPAPATPPATAKSGGAAPSTAARCVLLALQDSSLLKVFSFLEAPSVLNTAAACRGTFRKVDALFGFGNSESILQGSSSPPASSDPLKTPPRSAKQPSHSSVGSGFKSLFATVSQVRDEKEANAFPSTSSKEGNEGLALTADMVNAMALKLSNAEMKGIISMTARNKALTAQVSRQCEIRSVLSCALLLLRDLRVCVCMVRLGTTMQASQLRTEKEDVLEKLRSTEEVKEFLVQKLKETEAALKKSLDEKARTDRQAASDQEVLCWPLFPDTPAHRLPMI